MLSYAQPKWPDATNTMIFWAIALGMQVLGSIVFRHLNPEFADVL